MPINCPHCDKSFTAKKLKPGRRTPECPRCGGRFVVWLEVFKVEEFEAAVQNAVSLRQVASRSLAPAGGVSASEPDDLATRAGAPNESLANAENVDFSLNGASLQAAAPPVVSSSREADTIASEAPQPGLIRDSAEEPPEHFDPADEPATPRGKVKMLGGYKLLKELGRGGMGAVFMANQVSLDRSVAIKTIRGDLAGDPVFLSRFTREAYAAAQLTHHNVVQVYDLGEDGGIHFFSMEYVRGRSLDHLIAGGKKVDTHDAVSYVLQAARGLHFAHEHGMVHRDIKPANLMLSDMGIVKVADLGLVKTAASAADDAASSDNPSLRAMLDSGATAANSAMGTPAYVAPEQALDAASVDHRADIYALGCTLFSLLTGRKPFEGNSVQEVLSKHQTEKLVRPDKLVGEVPAEVGDIVQEMTAKRPDERPADLNEVVHRLERLLYGGEQGPAQKYGVDVERAFEAFREPPMVAMRPKVGVAVLVAFGLVAVALLAQGQLALSFAALLTAAVAIGSYLLVQSAFENSPVAMKLRDLAYSASWTDWLLAGASVGAIGATVLLTKLWMPVAAILALGVGAAVGFYQAIDRPLRKARADAISSGETILRKMRLSGLDESEIRRFFAEACGANWEEYFEELFGYEAKREQRRVFEQQGGRRLKKHAEWRDKLVDRVDSRLEALRDAKQRKQLKKVEASRYEAEGLNAKEARAKASGDADILVDYGAALRVSAKEYATADNQRRAALKKMVSQSKQGGRRKGKSLAARLLGAPRLVFGSTGRLAAGAALLLLGLVWASENQLFDADAVAAVRNLDQLQSAGSQLLADSRFAQMADLASRRPISFAPPGLEWAFNGFHLAAGGLLLMSTFFWSGIKSMGASWLAAVAALAGPFALRGVLPGVVPATPPLAPEELVSFGAALVLVAAAWWLSD